MKHPIKSFLVVCAAVTVASVTFQTTSASASPKACVASTAKNPNAGRLCLYMNTDYAGLPSMPAHENAKNKCLGLSASINKKTEAVINKSRYAFDVYSTTNCKPSSYLGHIYANSTGKMTGCVYYDKTSVFGNFTPTCSKQFQLKDNISGIIRIG